MEKFNPLPDSVFTEDKMKQINEKLYNRETSLKKLLDSGCNLEWRFGAFNGSKKAYVVVVDADGNQLTEVDGEKMPMHRFETPCGRIENTYLSPYILSKDESKIKSAKANLRFAKTGEARFKDAEDLQDFVFRFNNEGFVRAMIWNLDDHDFAPEIKRKKYTEAEKEKLYEKYMAKLNDVDVTKWPKMKNFYHKLFKYQADKHAAKVTESTEEILQTLESEVAEKFRKSLESRDDDDKRTLNPLVIKLIDETDVSFADHKHIHAGGIGFISFGFYGVSLSKEKTLIRSTLMNSLHVMNNGENNFTHQSEKLPDFHSLVQPEKRGFADLVEGDESSRPSKLAKV